MPAPGAYSAKSGRERNGPGAGDTPPLAIAAPKALKRGAALHVLPQSAPESSNLASGCRNKVVLVFALLSYHAPNLN